jgi:hypothetical protein
MAMVDRRGFRRARRIVGAVVATLAVATVLVPQASAAEAQMQALYNSDGSGKLFANGALEPFAWEQCDLALSTCAAVGGTGRELSVGGAPDSTIFRLSSGAQTSLSPTWHGTLSVAAPPSVEGTLRAGEIVTPVLATWQGGWDGSVDQTQLAACQTPTGENCTSLTDPKYVMGLPHGAVLLDQSFAGDYLRVADRGLGPDPVETADAYSSPYGHPVWPADGTTAVAVVGQIAASQTGPPSPEPSSPEPARRIKGSISARGVATAHCNVSCRTLLLVRRGRHTARVISVVKPTGAAMGVAKLRLARADLERLGTGRAHFVLEVDGKPVADKTILLPGEARPAKAKH